MAAGHPVLIAPPLQVHNRTNILVAWNCSTSRRALRLLRCPFLEQAGQCSLDGGRRTGAGPQTRSCAATCNARDSGTIAVRRPLTAAARRGNSCKCKLIGMRSSDQRSLHSEPTAADDVWGRIELSRGRSGSGAPRRRSRTGTHRAAREFHQRSQPRDG